MKSKYDIQVPVNLSFKDKIKLVTELDRKKHNIKHKKRAWGISTKKSSLSK